MKKLGPEKMIIYGTIIGAILLNLTWGGIDYLIDSYRTPAPVKYYLQALSEDPLSVYRSTQEGSKPEGIFITHQETVGGVDLFKKDSPEETIYRVQNNNDYPVCVTTEIIQEKDLKQMIFFDAITFPGDIRNFGIIKWDPDKDGSYLFNWHVRLDFFSPFSKCEETSAQMSVNFNSIGENHDIGSK